jgi:hypothetical protein
MEGLSPAVCYTYKYTKLCDRAFSLSGRKALSRSEVSKPWGAASHGIVISSIYLRSRSVPCSIYQIEDLDNRAVRNALHLYQPILLVV